MGSGLMRELEAISNATARDRILIAARQGGGNAMAGTPDKVAALLDTARALGAIGAPHALIGGIAVGIHAGVPRATADTDVAVLSTVDRATASRTLTDAGFRMVGEFRHSVNFRHASGEPVQLVFDPALDPMIERAERFAVGTVSVCIVRKEDLIVIKERAAADPARRRSKALRDRADVELLRGDVPDPDEGW
jgi:hypothetical protein